MGPLIVPAGMNVIKVNFAQPHKVKLPEIKIKTPPAPVPTYVAPARKQKPIILVPEIIYPHKKKRVFVHHDNPLSSYYDHMLYSMNPYYAQYALKNPYYQNIVANSKGFNNYLQGQHYTEMKSMLNKHVPLSETGGFMVI